MEIFLNPARDPLLWTLPVGFPVIRDGLMDVPQGDGLGVPLNPQVIEQYRVAS